MGKAIDPADHVTAAIEALEGSITERTGFLIAHHMEALAYRDGTLGFKARKRLRQSEHFDDLMLLRDLDSRGRQPGQQVGTIQEALDYIRSIENESYLEWGDDLPETNSGNSV